MKVNENFSHMPESYLFSEVASRIRTYAESHPETGVIRMDIGDVTRPLPQCVVSEMAKAVGEMGDASTFQGYGPEQGHLFLREAIARQDYGERGIAIEPDEIFISDGAKSDIGNLGDLFDADNCIGVTDPGYPVYHDANVIDGRMANIRKIPCRAELGFRPEVPADDDSPIDVIYLCYPNNPAGTVLGKEELTAWVEYARKHHSLIIYDSAYEAYIRSEDIPRSIYEIEGAKEVAIEVRSFSKTAGFTGLRCGYTVVPQALMSHGAGGSAVSLNKLWRRRQTTKFNGASYIVQRGAYALYSPSGREAVAAMVDYYMENAGMLRKALADAGLEVYGGEHSPYVWFRMPGDLTSWESFDLLLEQAGVSSTPGVGFGKEGEGWLRLTGFNSRENTAEAIRRLKSLFHHEAVGV